MPSEVSGPYIADFACIEARLVIEVDGATHGTQEERAYDERRTHVVEVGDWRVLRFTNDPVSRNREGVAATILMALEEQVERLRIR